MTPPPRSPTLAATPAATDTSPRTAAPAAGTRGTAAGPLAATGTAGASRWKTWLALVKEAGGSWSDDYAASMGAALAYYTLFSIAPMLLIAISVAGLVFGEDAARGQIVGQLRSLMGTEGAAAVEGLLESLRKPSQGVTGTLIGVGVLIIGATTVFGELQDALDRIWRAPQHKEGSSTGLGAVWTLVRTRLLSFGMVLSLGFLVMVSLVLGAVLSAWGTVWSPVFGGWEWLAQAANALVAFAVTTGAFAMIYKFMPRVHVGWMDVWVGALVTSLLFTIGKLLIGLYIGKSGVVSGFGAASSMVVLLVWVYYSAQIFLLGAEFTWVYAHRLGTRRGQDRPA